MSEDMENGGRSDSAGILAVKPNPGLKFEKKLSETERSTRVFTFKNICSFFLNHLKWESPKNCS